MLKNSHVLLPLFLVLFAPALHAGAGEIPARTPGHPDASSAIDDLASRYHELGRFSGVVLAARDGQEVFAKGYGLADRELGVPNTPDTKFRIGSLTKQFTATAILQLEAQGKLRMDAPIVTYLPDYPRPQGNEVTIHHLLSHSSGIPSLGRRGDGLDDVTGLREPIGLNDLLQVFDGRDLLFEPGDHYRYSNSAYTVAAAIVQAVSGLSWDRYLEERLFAPAGMRDTGVYDPTRIVPGLARGYEGYEPDVRKPLEEHPSWGVGAGGVFTTARDLLRWDRRLSSDSVLPAAQREEMFSHQIDWGEDGFYGYGWWGFELLGRRVFSHGGTSDGYVCDMYRVPSEGLTVIVLANHMPRIGANVPTTIAEQVLALLLGETMDPPPPPRPVEMTPAHLKMYEGTYEVAKGRRIRVEVQDDALWATAEGGRPWTVFTLAGSGALDEDTPAIRRATAFVEALRDHRFSDIVDGLFPKWRAEATPETFQGPFDEWREQWGELTDFAPVESTEGRFTSVTFLLRFEGRLVALDVVLDDELQYAGWWENDDIAQARVELLPSADGGFFVDGFRYRRDDLRVRFVPRSAGPETFEIAFE